LNTLHYVFEAEEAKAHAMHIAATFWADCNQFLEIIVDKLINYRILDPSAVVAWVFGPDHGQKDFNRCVIKSLNLFTIQIVCVGVAKVRD
jgi:hypothetical protein